MSRFIPVISFNLINYAEGLLNISGSIFFCTTGIGILPITILMVVMGDDIYLFTWQVWLLILAAGLLLWFVVNRLSGHIQSGEPTH